VSVVLCQLKVSSRGRSLAQCSPNESGVSECYREPHRGGLSPLGCPGRGGGREEQEKEQEQGV